ncbi:hypothetical protein ABZS83_30700 [Streptomyces sp. NPDC005426]|uniref:hypothetical protein n=1 Tax=Streptomyces sp. NPDC005426 TaxID=3155344 RepID=UPI0033A37E8D
MPDGTPHSGTISDLDKHRALLDWLRWQAGQTERRVRELGIQEVQERAWAEMSWKIQPPRPCGPRVSTVVIENVSLFRFDGHRWCGGH